MAVADKAGSAAYRRQGSSSYRNPLNASYATASNPYSSRYSAFKARGLAAAKQQAQTQHGDVSTHGSGYLQDVAYILNDDSGYQDEGDAAASSVSRAAGVARDRAINHFINKADLSEYHLDQPLPAANTGKTGNLSSGVVSTGYQMPNAGARPSQSFHFRRAQGNAAAAQSGNAMLSGSQAAASLAPVPYAAAASGTAIQTSVQTAKGWNSFSGMQHAAAQMPAAGRHLQQGVQPLPAAKLPKPSQSTAYSWQQRYAAQQSQKVAARRPSAHRLAATLKPQYQLRNKGIPAATHTERGRAAVSYAALPGKQVPQTKKTHVSAEHFGMKLHQGSGKRVVAHEWNAAGTGRHLRLAKIKKGAGKKRAEWLKRKSQPSLYARKQSSLTSAAKKAGRAYQKANKVIYTASLFAPDNAQDMGDAAASVPAKLMKEAGRRAASKTLRAARGKLASHAAKKQIGTSPSIRRANVRTMRKTIAKNAAQAAASGAGNNVVEVHSVSDVIHNLVTILKKVPSRIAGDIAALFGGTAAATLPGGVVAVFISALLVPALFLILLINIIIPSMGGSGALTGDVAEFAQFLKNDMGMNDYETAAIIANAMVESGGGASWTQGQPFAIGWDAESADGGKGILQWTGNSEVDGSGDAWKDKEWQKEYFKRTYYAHWMNNSEATYTDGQHSGVVGLGDFMETTDPAEAALIFMVGYERPSEVTAYNHYPKRMEIAQAVYASLTASSGTISDGTMSGSQQAVVNAAHSTPSPGYGYCAAWVTNVFQNAGIGYFGGNACDMYNSWCTSSNLDDLKPGMIIAVSTHNLDAAGRIYGHVGIYIGGGKVMDNIGAIRTIDVNQWISAFSGLVPAKWGWLGNVPLS